MSPVAAPVAVAKPTKKTRDKFTFMLHNPVDMTDAGKFTAAGYREAALKAASRGHTKILLRKCKASLIKEYAGSIVTLEKPKVVVRGTATVTYKKTSKVDYVRDHVFSGQVEDDEVPGETAEVPEVA